MSAGTLPLVRQIAEAEDDQGRACLLLAMPDAVLLACAEDVAAACRRVRFDAGAEFVRRRVALLTAVRQPDGREPPLIATHCEDLRAALAAFALREARP